jgi:hypothetical protein
MTELTPKSQSLTEVSALTQIEQSSSFERIIETIFLGELLQEMWFVRGQLVDVMHSTVDAFGYDLVLQADGVIRHVQLKAKKKGTRTARYALSTQLTRQPAACALLIEWAAEDGRISPTYRFFGRGPHEPIPDLGETRAKHARGNAQGIKGVREGLRVVGIGRFERLSGIAELAERLFGPVSA